MALDEEAKARITEFARELKAFMDEHDLLFWEGGIVRVAPAAAPPCFCTVEIEGVYDENVRWSGVPGNLSVGDQVLVAENPATHRREIMMASGATATKPFVHDHGDDDEGGTVIDATTFGGIATINAVWTHAANLVLDDGAGDSPELQFIGGSNDDVGRIWLDDNAVAGESDLKIRLPGGAANNSGLYVQGSDLVTNFYVRSDGWCYAISLSLTTQLDLSGGDIYSVGAANADVHAFIVKNTSGGAAIAGDLGYVDENGEYQTTATAYSDVEWCVVVVGGANNADIYIARRGRVTVALNGNCSVGDYLYTSTTAGQAQPQSYTRPELFAVALTANGAGAGGTCEALLLCHTRFVPATSSKWIIDISNADQSDFRATINAIAGAIVTYNAPIAGSDNTIDPQANNYLGKIRLYNETDGDYALIDDVNTGANQITLTANAPAGWAVGETITARSQTCVTGAAPYWYDLDLTDADNDAVPVLARAIKITLEYRDAATAALRGFVHPHEAEAGAKTFFQFCPAANVSNARTVDLPLIQRRFEIRWNGGAATARIRLSLMGYFEAAP